MTALTIHLFGELSVVDERGHAIVVEDRLTKALLVYLAVKGMSASRTEAARLLFHDPGAEAALYDVVHDLRGVLGADRVIDDERGLRLDDAVAVDAHEFDELVGAPSMNSVRKAVDLYRANLLEGFSSGIAAYDVWLSENRVSYWRAALTIFGHLLTAQIRAGWWEQAVETAGRLLSLDPSQEVVHRTLMRLQLEQGRPDSALRRYQECADILRRDYGREPDEDTERLRGEIELALAKTPAPREVVSTRSSGPVLILVVEDDLVSSALFDAYLVDAGYEVVTVADGGDALLELGRRHFDLLILDINIPTLSGLKVFEIMVQKRIDTPALFVTGMAGTDVEMHSLEMGAAGFLRKPIRKEVLVPKIRGILQRKRRSPAAQNGE